MAFRHSALAALIALTGCTTVHGSMRSSAQRLDARASAFVIQARAAGRQFPQAADFASEAHQFVSTINGADDRAVLQAYERLWDDYHTLHDQIARSGSTQARGDFTPVTQAFDAVVFDIRGYADADNSLYARGGFQHDPYYDP